MKATFCAVSILAIATIAYVSYFKWATAGTDEFVSGPFPKAGLAWVRTAYDLTAAESAAVESANAAFLPGCEEMCMKLAMARQELTRLTQAAKPDLSEIESAYSAVAEIEEACFRMTLKHIDEVSRLMPPEAGARYRSEMIQELVLYRTGHHNLLSKGGVEPPADQLPRQSH